MLVKVFLLLAFINVAFGGFFWGSSQTWDGLRTTWGLNPFSSIYFAKQPRTQSAAISNGWRVVQDACDGSEVLGFRYQKGSDATIQLVFDVNGFVAGIATTIPKNLSNYPTVQTKKFWRDMGSSYLIVAYFTKPSKICTTGRTQTQFDKDGTGDGVWIQTGADATQDSNLEAIPMTEAAQSGTMWTKGRCFYSMGQHYWYNLRQNMNCDEFMPVFLLYNSGKLNGFGWAVRASLAGDRYEHPTPSITDKFMAPPPKCILDYKGVLSTMHIYMTDSPRSSFC